MPEWNGTVLSELLTATKDGDWGSDSPAAGLARYFVIRGTDFPTARFGNVSGIPIRYLSEQTVTRRTLEPGDIVIETAGGSKDRPTGRTLLVSEGLLNRLGGPVTCASFARFLRVNREKANPRFIYWYLQFLHQNGGMWGHQVQHTGVARFQYTRFAESHKIPLPPLQEQEAIASVLGALDDKIAVNDRIVESSRDLGLTYFRSAVAEDASEEAELASIVEFLNRGVTPRYTEDESQLRVLNQRCIRGGRISLAASRRTIAGRIPQAKILRRHDVLVNSTGVGTLGRLARWTRTEVCSADSHITIVRFDPAKTDPICAGFGMLGAEREIEALGEGSTGQTELSRAQLAALRLVLPSRDKVIQLRPKLDALENRADSALEESLTLAELRDTLLPKLISGEIRVKDAEQAVEEAT